MGAGRKSVEMSFCRLVIQENFISFLQAGRIFTMLVFFSEGKAAVIMSNLLIKGMSPLIVLQGKEVLAL